jgi:hypothetical protein
MGFHLRKVEEWWMSGSVLSAVLCAVVVTTFTGPVDEPLVPSESADSYEWMTMLVDPGQNRAGQYNSIALDSNGYPHISYEENDHRAIKYARWTGTEWITEFADNSSAGISSIDLDSKDNPHIVHTTHNLRYAWWDGARWIVSTLDNSEVLGFAEIVIDDKDNPHVVYRHDQFQIRYLYWDGGKWMSENVSSINIGLAASLALDHNGIPHLAFFSEGRLTYATRYGGNWYFEVPDPTTHVGSDSCTSIAIDSKGFPHISYQAMLLEDLKYAHFDGNNWLLETLDTDFAGHDSSIALDKDDFPRISYRARHNLKYADWTGTEWNIEVVDNMQVGSSLALDKAGNPHISYHKSYSLYFATGRKIPQQPELELDIDPDTLNMKSEGRWITAYLKGENVEDIDASTLLLNDMISPAWWDVQNDTTLMAKFSRSYVQMIVPTADEVDIKVTGQWKGGKDFELHDTIRVIDPGSYLVAPDSISSRDRSTEYFREEFSVFAPVRRPTDGFRVQFMTWHVTSCPS